jgi:hypothetical protein
LEPWTKFLQITDEDFANLTVKDKKGALAVVQLWFNHYKDKAWILGTHLDNINSWSLVAKPIKLITWDSFNDLLNGKVDLKKLKTAKENVQTDSLTNKSYVNGILQNNPKNAKTADSMSLNLNQLDITEKELDSLKNEITNLDNN